MNAIILAGGLGSRLQEVIRGVPKPMAPVGGKPFLEYLLLQLKGWDIKDILLSVGYKKEVIRSYFGNGRQLGLEIEYSEEDTPLGTGGALKKALLAGSNSTYSIVMNGDSFFAVNLPDLIAFQQGKPALLTMALVEAADKSRYGGVELSADGEITAFKEKGLKGPGLINGGFYLIHRDLAEYIPEGQTSLEKDVLPVIKHKHLVYGKVCRGFFIDMGLPEDYRWLDQHAEYISA